MLLNQPWLLVFFVIFFVWLGGLTYFLIRLRLHYRRLTKGITKKELRAVLEKLLKEKKAAKEQVEVLVKETKGLKKDNLYHFQKMGLVRYNPFAETGGDQSFCLALLDKEGSGLVVTSLHSRDTTRVYAKPVKKNKAAGYELSAEEKQAIKKAKKTK